MRTCILSRNETLTLRSELTFNPCCISASHSHARLNDVTPSAQSVITRSMSPILKVASPHKVTNNHKQTHDAPFTRISSPEAFVLFPFITKAFPSASTTFQNPGFFKCGIRSIAPQRHIYAQLSWVKINSRELQTLFTTGFVLKYSRLLHLLISTEIYLSLDL